MNPVAKYVICVGLHLSATAPEPDQEGVPTDARLALEILDGGCDAGAQELSATLVRTDDSATVAEWEFEQEELRAARGVLTFSPSALEPDTDYTLLLAGIGGMELPFTTGSDPAEGMNEAPLWGSLDAAWIPCEDQARILWTASPAPDPDGLSVLELRSGAEVVARALPGSGGGEALIPLDDPEAPLCLELVQVDARGVAWSAGEQCATPVEEPCSLRASCGCAVDARPGLPAILAALSPLALALRLRR